MLEINDWTSFVIGIVSGVAGSYLIYAVFHIIGNYAARKKFDEFISRFGILNGYEYYEDIAKCLENGDYKSEMTRAVADYVELARKHEENLNAILTKYTKDELDD